MKKNKNEINNKYKGKLEYTNIIYKSKVEKLMNLKIEQ